jgi:septal ring factor EnvC (AmiA/AmiB activator)
MAMIDQQLAAARSELESARTNEARIAAELEALEASRGAMNHRLHARARSLYRVTRAGMLPLAGGFDSMLAHMVRIERLRRMVRQDASALNELTTRTLALRAEVGRLEGTIENASARAAQLEADKRILAEDVRRATLYAQAFGEYVPSPAVARVLDPALTTRGESGSPSRDSESASSNFERERGELALPIAAPRQVRPAMREEAQGLELDGARGASVRSAAAGRVAFSDRHPAYGRLVIVDHGNGYFTVYGGLARIDAQMSDRVERGANLGTVDGEPLFFQVRRGTRSLDASAWLGL